MSEMKKSSTSIIIGFWTGVVVWIILMFAFKWWGAWWAYFPLMGTIFGAVRKTADFLHNEKLSNGSVDEMPTQDHNPTTDQANNINLNQSNSVCPGCGHHLEEENLKFCPTCGYHL